MSTRSSERRAPRGHGLYVRVRDALPARAAEALTELATTIRHVRLRIRLSRRRTLRRIARRERRLRVKTLRRLGVGSWTEQRASTPSTPSTNVARPSGHRWSSRLANILDPASLELPGDGPTIALDARGLRSDEVLQYIADHDLDARTVVVVDDPNVATLRDADVFYEYAPETPEVPADRRMRWIVSAYGVDRIDVARPSVDEGG